MKKRSRLLFAGVMLAGLLCGCTSAGQSKDSQSMAISQKTSERKEEEKIVLGQPSPDSKKVTLVNETGAAITAFTLAPAELSSLPDNLLKESEVWKDNEEAQLYLSQDEVESESLLLTITVNNNAANGPTSLSGSETSQSESGQSSENQESAEADQNDTQTQEYALFQFPAAQIGEKATVTIEEGQLVITWSDGSQDVSIKGEEPQTPSQEDEVSEEIVEEPASETEEAANDSSQSSDSSQPVFPEPVYEQPVYFAPDGTEQDGQPENGQSAATSTEASFEEVE